jgi:hypothetical protein
MDDADEARLRRIDANIAAIENRSMAERMRLSALLKDLRAARGKIVGRVPAKKPWRGARA